MKMSLLKSIYMESLLIDTNWNYHIQDSDGNWMMSGDDMLEEKQEEILIWCNLFWSCCRFL